MQFLWKYIQRYQKDLYLGLSTKTVGALLELLLPFILSHIIDVIVPTKQIPSIVYWSLFMVVCAFFAWRLNVYANRKASFVARNTTEALRHDLFDQSLYLSCQKADQFTIPSLETRLTTDTYHVHRMLGMLQRMGIRGPIIILGGLVITFYMDATLALVLLATVPFIGFLVYFRASKGVPLFKDVQKVNDQMVRVVRENAQGVRVIKAFSKTAYEQERYHEVNELFRHTTVHAQSRMAIINPGMNLILNLGQLGVVLVGAYMVSQSKTTTGTILAFMSYFTIIARSMMAIGRIFIMYSQGIASSHRIQEVIESSNEKDWIIQDYPTSDPQYAIEFKDVTFSYHDNKNHLEHISFQLKQGQSLGIVGATGSGKSTILSLLLHLYDIKEGAIYLNGKDIRSFSPSELRKQFGVVLQNDFLFRDTIKENVFFGREASMDEFNEAIEVAQAAPFINDIAEKEEYVLTGKGANLSGGQRQRLLLARAFLTHPKFLLLDDSSSALDYNTDAKLRKALFQSQKESTKIIVAQRISSILNCDHILILDHGKIENAGNHEYLLEHSTLYSDIYDSQMGGALFD